MPQSQLEIPLQFADGTVSIAVLTGNNAAWMCGCGRVLPLIGYSDSVDTRHASSDVVCPQCGAAYRVVAPGARKVPTEVRQLARPGT
jgi:hypothetical protein